MHTYSPSIDRYTHTSSRKFKRGCVLACVLHVCVSRMCRKHSSVLASLMHAFVPEQSVATSELLAADDALKWLLAGVSSSVCLQVMLLSEVFRANVTVEWFLSGVSALVDAQCATACKLLAAHVTVVGFGGVVGLWDRSSGSCTGPRASCGRCRRVPRASRGRCRDRLWGQWCLWRRLWCRRHG